MMKKLLFICLVGCMSILQSCKDECKDVTCANGGTCVEGTCDCADGYAGDTCDLVAREGLLGVWTGNSVCPDEPATAESYTISEGTTISTILISDGEGSDPLEATVTGLNTFTIDAFTLEVFGFVVTTDGDGSINSSGQLVMNVNADIAGFGSTTCVFTGAK